MRSQQMSALRVLVAAEAKQFLREPLAVGFGVIFPTVILLALGAIPALREPSEEYSGARFVEVWTPTALVLGIGILAIQGISADVATSRDNGILRRMATTPVSPARLLLAKVIVVLTACVVAGVMLIVSARVVLDVPVPQRPGWFILAFLIGFGAALAIGLMVAAVAPNARAANGMATVAYMVTMFAGGVFMPRFLLPEWLQRIGDYIPPGSQTLTDAWSDSDAVAQAVGLSGAGAPQVTQLAIMALIAVACATVAARTFRWE